MPSGFHTWSQTASSNASADSAINFAEGQAPSSVNDSARAEMAVLAKWRDDNNGSLTTGGTSTAFTLTTNTGFTSLALLANQTVAFTMNATSGATPTLNVDSLGAKVIRNATGVALPTGALLSGSVYRATYNNSSGEFLLHNQPGVLPSNSVVTASIADANVTLAKIVNTAASRLLGNPTGSAAAPSEISLSGGLAFSGTALKATTVPITSQRFTSSSGTYTTPAGCTCIKVRMIGGGGGGGGGDTSSAASGGGNTTFSTLTAGGGAGGIGGGTAAGTVSSAGGSASGGDINIPGGAGGGGGVTVPNGIAGGIGGSGAFGGAGGANGGSGATNSGGGGGGGYASASAQPGGGGGSGGYVEKIISSPAATYSYAVGAAGSGSSSGGAGAGNGGSGAAGIIIVEEFY